MSDVKVVEKLLCPNGCKEVAKRSKNETCPKCGKKFIYILVKEDSKR